MNGERWLGRLDHFDLVARWYDRLICTPEDGRLGELLAVEPGQAVKSIVLMEKVLLMGSRFLDLEQLAELLRAAGAPQVMVHPDGASARVVVEGVRV